MPWTSLLSNLRGFCDVKCAPWRNGGVELETRSELPPPPNEKRGRRNWTFAAEPASAAGTRRRSSTLFFSTIVSSRARNKRCGRGRRDPHDGRLPIPGRSHAILMVLRPDSTGSAGAASASIRRRGESKIAAWRLNTRARAQVSSRTCRGTFWGLDRGRRLEQNIRTRFAPLPSLAA